MKMYKDDGKEYIPADSPTEINLREALREIEEFPISEEGFIGFINERDESIQFIRFDEDDWLIDVPFLENEKYAYSLQDDIDHSLVKEITTRFFWRKGMEESLSVKKSVIGL